MTKRIARFGADVTLIVGGLALVVAVVLAGIRHTDDNNLAAGGDAPVPAAPADPTAPAPAPTDAHLDADVALAAQMITSADKGGNLNHTMRWAGPAVTYHVAPAADWTPEFIAEVDAAIRWAAQSSGLTFTPVGDAADAQLQISGRSRPGGSVWVVPAARGVIGRAHVELGCCSPRVAYEEIGQSLGVLADLGDDRSVFSANRTRLRPGDWDTWVIAGLYRAPAGADTATAAEALRAAAHR